MTKNPFNLLYKNELKDKLNSSELLTQKEAEFKLDIDFGGADCLYVATRNPMGGGLILLEISNGKGEILREAKTEQVAHNGYTMLRFAPFINVADILEDGELIFKLKCTGGCCVLSDGTLPGLMLYRSNIPHGDTYSVWLGNNVPNKKELLRQRNHKFKYGPLVSIVTPLYNTPERYFRDLLDSVTNQTYGNWELCLSDGSDRDTKITDIIAEYNDSRIKYKKLEINGGISLNTNQAIDMASGEYIAFLDHDDTLAPHALFSYIKLINEDSNYELLYSDEDKLSEDGFELSYPFFKPDYSPHLLLSQNYITHFMMVKHSLLKSVGYLDKECDGAQDYDLVLRVSEKAKKVGHISDILYHWRISQNSTANQADAKPYTVKAGHRAVTEALRRRGNKGTVYNAKYPNMYRTEYQIPQPEPLVSIIIPNKDELDTLKNCVSSIIQNTEYNNYEILIIENNSTDKNLLKYYDELSGQENIRVVTWDKPFNYSAINNFAVKHAKGKLLLFLNNDTKVINSDWLTQMVMLSVRPEIGAVGAKLLYPDDTLQHAEIIVRFNQFAGLPYCGVPVSDAIGPVGRFTVVHDVSAVTGACLMVRNEVFEEIGGFDENLAVAFNDVDLCLKIRELGLYNVYTPYAQLYHYESKTRGYDKTPEKFDRLYSEGDIFLERWAKKYPYDPFYNRNLIMSHPGYEINTDKAPEQYSFEK